MLLRFSLALVAAVTLFIPAPLLAAPAGYSLVWSDEFNGTSVDPTKWNFDIGDGCPNLCGWGNNELQYYRLQNAAVSGGFLTITAKQESFGGKNYTSARLNSKSKGDWTYGRVEIRAKLPIGRGIWPAFWMLPTGNVYGTWAASGEIDMMEYLGQNPNEVFGTLHYGGQWPNNTFTSNDFTLASGTFHDSFHDFAMEWAPGEIRWYVDGQLYACQNDWWSSGGPYGAPFDQDFHLILNMAVGGNLPGPPDGSTVFPQQLIVDYVRVYQKTEGCGIVFAGMESDIQGDWFTFNGVGGGGIGANFASVPPDGGCVRSLGVGWGSGGTPGFMGGFGRENPRNVGDMTHFSFWIDPDPGQDYTLLVQLQDDDDGNNSIPSTPNGADDEFEVAVTVKPSGGDVVAGGGWQQVTIPLANFVDDNSYHWGGNGVFDPVPTSSGGNGQLINVVYTLLSTAGSNVTFRTDRWEFTREDGALSGLVWEDTDGNGVQNGGESGVSGISVNLYDDASNLLGTKITTASGSYAFGTLPAGDLRVEVVPSGVLVGASPTADPDGIGTPHEACVPLACGATQTGLDFGYQPPLASVDGGTFTGPVLLAGMPNPFRSSTQIQFNLDDDAEVRIRVFDVAGRPVRHLARGAYPAGTHLARWNGTDDQGQSVANGMYLVILEAGGERRVQRALKIGP